MKSVGSVLVNFSQTKPYLHNHCRFCSSRCQIAKNPTKNNILKKVKNYIDNELNPSKRNFLDSTK